MRSTQGPQNVRWSLWQTSLGIRLKATITITYAWEPARNSLDSITMTTSTKGKHQSGEYKPMFSQGYDTVDVIQKKWWMFYAFATLPLALLSNKSSLPPWDCCNSDFIRSRMNILSTCFQLKMIQKWYFSRPDWKIGGIEGPVDDTRVPLMLKFIRNDSTSVMNFFNYDPIETTTHILWPLR